MPSFEFKVFLLWLDNASQIMQWVAVVLIVAHVSMRVRWLKTAIQGAQSHWRYGLIASVFFGLLAVMGNHSRMMWEIDTNGHIEIVQYLSSKKWPNQPSVSLRDLMALVAGLLAGPWVGLSAGLVAGSERFFIGGFTGTVSGITTPLLGMLAGFVMRFCPRCTLNHWWILVVAVIATWIKLLIVYYFVTPIEYAHNLVRATIIPAMLVNTIGCLLFLTVIKDLERERLEQLVQASTLRALKAQIEPHFLNNTLNDLHTFIRTDPDRARDYVVLLADFCNDTRQFSERNTISLHQELTQLQRYLDFQSLRLGNKLQVIFDIPDDLFSMQVIPGCLLTFVENALKHGFRKRSPPYKIRISAEEQAHNLVLSVSDNGCGIISEQKVRLGSEPIQSMNKGGGVALYQLAQCLNLIFGKDACMTFDRSNDGGTIAKLIQPKQGGL